MQRYFSKNRKGHTLAVTLILLNDNYISMASAFSLLIWYSWPSACSFLFLDEKKRTKEKSRQNNASTLNPPHARYFVGPALL